MTGSGGPPPEDVRAEWDAEYVLRERTETGVDLRLLPPPADLRAESGIGQVTLRWSRVPGSEGYLVLRGPVGGPLEPVDHHGDDVRAVPDPVYVDTTGERGTPYDYAVCAVVEVTRPGPPGDRVRAAATVPGDGPPPLVEIRVAADAAGVPLARPWAAMIGSERLSQLRCRDTTGGRVVGDELAAALARVHDEIGVRAVRAHAVLHDDLHVYTEVDGQPVHDFTLVDEVYDRVLAMGLRPTVELGFMPAALASEPDATVFAYRAHNSPPRDDRRWADLVTDVVRHLLDRYGDRVLAWDFEVWNEANIEPFWTSTRQRWLEFYDVTAAAVRAADARLAVGGPASAAAGWVDDLLEHVAASGAPLDFVSTHTYGSPPLDLRPALERHGRAGTRILWTEWGVTPTHFNPVNDSVSAATFLLTGMRSAAGRVEALSWWVASDHFEELGRPPRLLHGGFGLVSVGGIAKPTLHALTMLAALGDTEVPVEVNGDGGGGLVQAWVGRHPDGRLTVVVWNHTLDQSRHRGDRALARRVRLVVDGRAGAAGTVARLDATHASLADTAGSLGVGDWPADEAQWAALRAVDTLVAEPLALGPDATVELDLPQPGAVLLQF